MRIRANVGIDLLGMVELETTLEVYLLPGGMTGTDHHAWLFTSLCWFSEIDEQSKGLCY